MAQQLIDRGTKDNPKTGDSLYDGAGKINDNFTELYDDKADKSNVLELNNTTPFTPDADYEPATKKYVDDSGGGSSPIISAYKTVDETKVNDSTPVIDDDLQITLDANSFYSITINTYFSTETSIEDIRFSFTYPSLSEIFFKPITATGQNDGNTIYDFGTLGSNTRQSITFLVTIKTDSGGVFGLNWSQRLNRTTGTTLLKNSCIIATKLN